MTNNFMCYMTCFIKKEYQSYFKTPQQYVMFNRTLREQLIDAYLEVPGKVIYLDVMKSRNN